MLVPLRILVSTSERIPTDRTLTPGAKTSTGRPKLEKGALASFWGSMAPTVMALGADAGEVSVASFWMGINVWTSGGNNRGSLLNIFYFYFFIFLVHLPFIFSLGISLRLF